MNEKIRNISLLLFMILFSCVLISNKKQPNQKIYDFDAFDSLCIADSIPRDLNTWESVDYWDDEENTLKTKFYLNVGDSISYIVFYNKEGDFVVEKNKL